MWWILFISVAALDYECKYTLPDGNTVDLYNMYNPISDYSISVGSYEYILNICGDTLKQCPGDAFSIATQWIAGSCVSILARQEPRPLVVDYMNPEDPGEGVKLTYFNGDICLDTFTPRKVVYNLHCEDSSTELYSAEEESKCVYFFNFYTIHACPVSKTGKIIKSKSLSWGWIFLIGLLISLVLYCILGVYFNYRNGERDSISDSIPNKEFWIELPSLVYTGIHFSVFKTVECINRLRGKEV